MHLASSGLQLHSKKNNHDSLSSPPILPLELVLLVASMLRKPRNNRNAFAVVLALDPQRFDRG